MGNYRLPQINRRPRLKDAAQHSSIVIDNGALSRFSIPCYYKIHRHASNDFHHRMMHDHLGWPSPDTPDNSCQNMNDYSHIDQVVPIDLEAEGYEMIIVSLIDPPDGLYFSGEIDGHIIRLTIYPMCADAEEEDIDVSFCVYAVGGEWDFMNDDEPTPMDNSSSDNEGSSEASSSDVPSSEGTSDADPSATGSGDDIPDEAIKKKTFRDVVIKGNLHIVAGPIR